MTGLRANFQSFNNLSSPKTMSIDESSVRLNLLRFPLIVGVVFIHAYRTNVEFAGGSVVINQGTSLVGDFLRNLVSQGFAQIAVPLFFLMSGFLFFRNFTWSTNGYLEKIRSRIHTLLVPFVFWNIAALILVAIAQALPETATYFSGKNNPIASYNGLDYLSAIFGIGRMPISYQFWFLRDLMLLALATPAIYVAAKFASGALLTALFSTWVMGFWPVSAPSNEATLFFSLGCVLSIKDLDLFRMDAHGKVITIVYCIIALADVAFAQTISGTYIHKLAIIFGIATALYLTAKAAKVESLKHMLLSLGAASFFIYAAHEPVLTIFKKIIYKVLQPDSPHSVLALYFAIPIFVIMVLLAINGALRTCFPEFSRVINGGRTSGA